jgi:hypothetical protein
LPVVASNLVLGPCDLYVGPFGAAEPPDSAITPNPMPPGFPFIDVGGTDGGVTFEVDETLTSLTADQVTMDLGARSTETKITVTAKLAEVTLANFQLAINQIGSFAQGDGFATLDIPVGVTSTQPLYSSLIIDGFAPNLPNGMSARRRIIVRKVLSQPKVSLVYDKKTQNSYDITWQCYYVSASVDPAHVVDQQQ